MIGSGHFTSNMYRLNYVGSCVLFCLLSALYWWYQPAPGTGLIWGIAVLWGLVVIGFPFIVILTFIVFSFFRIHEVIPQLDPLRLPQMLAIAALVVLFWHIFISKSIHPFWCREFTWLTWFFVLVIVGSILAIDRVRSLEAVSDIFLKLVSMTFAIAWLMHKPIHFAAAIRVFILSGLLVASVALYNKSAGIGLVEGTRVTIARDLDSILGDPNDLALVLLFPAGFSLATMFESRAGKWARFLGGSAFIVNMLAIIATQSRGGLLGICAVMFFFAYYRIKSKALLVSLVCIALLLLFTVAEISERSSGGSAEVGLDESAMGRIYAWEAAWGMLLDNPFFGIGLKNYYYNYYFYTSHWDGRNHAVHSTWLEVLSETGLLGFTAFFMMMKTTFFRAWKSLQKLDHTVPSSLAITMNGVVSSIVGFCVSGTFLTQGFIWSLYLQLALSVAAMRLIEKVKVQ